MACGEIGLKIEDYYNLTQRQFFNILKGYQKKQEFKLQQQWEQARLIAYYSVQWAKKPPKITEFMPLATDAETNKTMLKATKTAAEIEAFYKEKNIK